MQQALGLRIEWVYEGEPAHCFSIPSPGLARRLAPPSDLSPHGAERASPENKFDDA